MSVKTVFRLIFIMLVFLKSSNLTELSWFWVLFPIILDFVIHLIAFDRTKK